MKRHADGKEDNDDGNDKNAELSAAAPVSARAAVAEDHGNALTASSTPTSTLQRDSRKRITSSSVPFGSLSEAFGYVVFLILFIVATSVIEENEQAFYFANRIKSALVEQPFATAVTLRSTNGIVISSTTATGATTATVQKSFGVIQDQPDVWAFLQGPFADVIYGPEICSNTSNEDVPEAAGMPLSYNRVLGGVRLRTLRVKPDSCPLLSQIPEYSSIVPYCYSSFSTAMEQRDGYGPILNSGDITASTCFAFAKDFFADKATTKSYADLQICYSDCERTCGEYFGVEMFRYVAACDVQCGIHCKCIYEQPVGFTDLCPDPNPNGVGAALPIARYSFNWSSSKDTESLASNGYTGTTYSGSGYVVDLAVNGTLARSTLGKLREDRYLDLATRALVIDVTVYNAYLQLFNIVQLVVEFPATGGVFVQFSDVVLHPFRYSASNSSSLIRIVLECLLVAYVTFCWKTMLQGMYRSGGAGNYLRSSAWSVVTLLFLLVFAAVIGFRLYMIDQEYGTLSGRVANAIDSATLSTIPRFQSLARLCYAEGVLGSVNAALVWLKLLQYTQMSQRMCLLLRMLRRAAMDLFWFAVYFFVCLCGFAQIGYLLFGLSVRQFRSLGVAILSLLQAVAGDLDYGALSDAHRVLGPLFYIVFYLLLLFVLLNVFLAILNDAYLQTVTEQEEEEYQESEDVAGRFGINDQQDSQGRGALDDNGGEVAEELLSHHARREMAQLRKYPFSKGFSPAIRLLVADIKHRIYELRTGRKVSLTKVDPFVSGMSVQAHSGVIGTTTGGSSRKWTMQVKKQLDKQIQQHAQLRLSQELQNKDREMDVLRETIDKEISEKLVGLVESSRQKTQRMGDMEKVLGAIEQLCQKLITDTAYLRDESDNDESSARGRFSNGSGGSRGSGGGDATKRRIQSPSQQQRRTTTTTLGGVGSGSSALQSSTRRTTAMFKPQSLATALRSAQGDGDEKGGSRSGSGGGSNKKLLTKRGSTEDIEEITL
ncbi:hypothetical protein Gpo141_00012072 [Globisporangium polare]